MDSRLFQLPCGYMETDLQYVITDINETLLNWTNYKREDLIGKHIEKLFSASSKLIFHSYLYPNMSIYHFVDELFIHVQSSEGHTIPCLVNAKEIQLDDAALVSIVFMPMKKRIDHEREVRQAKLMLEEAYKEKTIAYEHLHRINKEIENKQEQLLSMNEELTKISNTDNLTGIANRRFFQQQLTDYVEKYRQNSVPFSLLVMDIDHFKQVNDKHGHAIGDLVLAQLGLILNTVARENDTVARFGGEEFVLLLGETAEEEAFQLAQNLNKRLEQTIWPTIGMLTVSIGCATFQEDDTEISIFEHADEALYEAKRKGRNCTIQYETWKDL
ncbi:sensor domain-containing diguanylate cyclase [Solibacillus sp. A46]|uniref:Sensor domain-containing diguanylate cyclase n=1 Tax=Solibacillus faecavium TaxID=2762221 RepID=A0ABR8XT50_9BACL|nr:sensor domain-containing diguanylate cyclase [Solibacillus faecavium]MBD8035114.1 sensor domain-containing diguanylate cyclase [Solibacillus faecavium]